MPLRILHVAPSIARAYGGPTQSLAGYARAAHLHGCHCTIVAPEADAADVTHFQALAPHASLVLFQGYGAGAFVSSPALVRFAARHAGEFDVVHAHGLFNPISSLATRGCRRAGRPVIIRPFGTMSRYTFQHRRGLLKRAYLRALDGPNLRGAAGIHFTTRQERDEASRLDMDVERRAFVIPPPAMGQEAPVPRLVRSADSGAPTALLISRLNPVKNIELLLDAWALVRAQLDGARLVIAGDGPAPYRRALAERARALGIAEAVRFTGYADDAQKRSLYAAADLFVLPSKHENFGIAALEALAAGLPVVVSRDVQLAEFVDQHRLGRVVVPEAESLAAALAALWHDEAWRRDCAARAPRLVADTFSPDAIGSELRAMYDRVLASALEAQVPATV